MRKRSRHPTLLVVTPTGMSHRQKIEQMIPENGLHILKKETFFPSEKQIEGFIGRKEPRFIEKWQLELPGNKCAYYIIGGDDALRKMLKLCGESTTPQECSLGTIRAMIPDIPSAMENGDVWFYTPVFTSESREKLRADFENFGLEKYLESKNWHNGSNGTH